MRKDQLRVWLVLTGWFGAFTVGAYFLADAMAWHGMDGLLFAVCFGPIAGSAVLAILHLGVKKT